MNRDWIAFPTSSLAQRGLGRWRQAHPDGDRPNGANSKMIAASLFAPQVLPELRYIKYLYPRTLLASDGVDKK